MGAVRAAFVLLLGSLLLSAILGGLLRAGALSPTLQAGAVIVGQAAVAHASLMLSSFLGSVIALERAVALRQRWAFASPLLGMAGGVIVTSGVLPQAFAIGAVLNLLSSLCFVAVNLVLVARQRHFHILLMLVGALAWLVGNVVFLLQRNPAVALLWWFAFVILTITAERLEMSRLMRQGPLSRPLLLLAVMCLLAGVATSLLNVRNGSLLFGVSLLALAAWLCTFDIARRTIRAQGLSRYMALCLLAGYGWLAVSGWAWVAMGAGIGLGQGDAVRDVALHALGLGFVFSMIMGHAPVILPAVARVKVLFGSWFYAPLALMHVSLLVRCGAGWWNPDMRSTGALLNALAIALFAITMAGSGWAWRRRHGHDEGHIV